MDTNYLTQQIISNVLTRAQEKLAALEYLKVAAVGKVSNPITGKKSGNSPVKSSVSAPITSAPSMNNIMPQISTMRAGGNNATNAPFNPTMSNAMQAGTPPPAVPTTPISPVSSSGVNNSAVLPMF